MTYNHKTYDKYTQDFGHPSPIKKISIEARQSVSSLNNSSQSLEPLLKVPSHESFE
jgi:hypothetical protein